MKPSHPWKARLAVGLIMLMLALVGIIITDIHREGGWDYWRFVVPIYALLALGLSFYIKRTKETISPITLWHELLHWAGVIGAVLLVSYLVQLGTVGRFIAGIFQLIILGLGLFLAGIYIEVLFIVVGITLAGCALITAALIQYLYAIVVPLLIGAALFMIIFIWVSHRVKHQK
ncbi:MAG: hypothetical protein RLZZ453_184 [Chlamydiota bacterium]|jgi:hypothetical protein